MVSFSTTCHIIHLNATSFFLLKQPILLRQIPHKKRETCTVKYKKAIETDVAKGKSPPKNRQQQQNTPAAKILGGFYIK